jgi:hypothetical protein
MVPTLFYYINIFMLIVGCLHKKSGNFKFEMPLYRQSDATLRGSIFVCYTIKILIAVRSGVLVLFIVQLMWHDNKKHTYIDNEHYIGKYKRKLCIYNTLTNSKHKYNH